MLPYAIEYLLTLERPGGGRLVQQGGSQTIVPVVPPNTQIVLNVFPLAGDYIDILYHNIFDPAMVPMVYFAVEQHWGQRTHDGTLTSSAMAYPIDSYIIISESEPAFVRIFNMSPVNQFYSGAIFFIAVKSEGDYNLVKEALRFAGTSQEEVQLARESNRLLRKIAGEPPAEVE